MTVHRAWWFCKACHEKVRNETAIKRCKCRAGERAAQQPRSFIPLLSKTTTTAVLAEPSHQTLALSLRAVTALL